MYPPRHRSGLFKRFRKRANFNRDQSAHIQCHCARFATISASMRCGMIHEGDLHEKKKKKKFSSHASLFIYLTFYPIFFS